MNEEHEDLINPESWTTKELVKHIYRELKKANGELHGLKKDVSELKDDMKVRKQREIDREGEFNKRVAIIGIAGVVLGLIIDAVIGLFK